MKAYRFTRDATPQQESFSIGPQGVVYVDSYGNTAVDIHDAIPGDVIAATVVDLALAGWELVQES